MTTFVLNHSYSRREIFSQLGGNMQSFLPFTNGRVVAACVCPELNPQAPLQILAGDAPGVLKAARMLSGQSGTIPVFLKRGSSQWEYQGLFAVGSWTDDPAECEAAAKAARRDDPIRLVINLKQSGS